MRNTGVFTDFGPDHRKWKDSCPPSFLPTQLVTEFIVPWLMQVKRECCSYALCHLAFESACGRYYWPPVCRFIRYSGLNAIVSRPQLKVLSGNANFTIRQAVAPVGNARLDKKPGVSYMHTQISNSVHCGGYFLR